MSVVFLLLCSGFMRFSRILAILFAANVLWGSVQLHGEPWDENAQTSPSLAQIDAEAAQRLGDSISTSEWLGPMAPIALSPFFGITCLSGMSIFGEGTFVANNEFISHNPVLKNAYVFWSFLFLTLVTSLPRLTKVSKPIAQILDQVETYSGIVTIIVIRWMATSQVEPATAEVLPVIQMGVLSFSADVFLVVAAAINIFVINLVKFFFEALIWLTPIPAIDAIFEFCNKAICLSLMAVYAWSPWLATALNLMMFVACAIVFRRIYRSVVYLRTLLTDPIWKRLRKSYGRFQGKAELVVFPQKAFGPFPAKSRLVISRSEEGWTLNRRDVLGIASGSIELIKSETQIQIDAGFMLNRLIVTGEEEGTLIFSRRYSGELDQVAEKLNFQTWQPDENISLAVG